jgi:CheY-like chemotaxis protein
MALLERPSSHTVLIVDDAPEMRLLLSTALSLEGYDVVAEVASGGEAIASAADTHPDVIILDGRMPQMSGLDALPGVRAAAPEAKVVVFSAEPPAQMEGAALAAGADAYVDKLAGAFGILEALGRMGVEPHIAA